MVKLQNALDTWEKLCLHREAPNQIAEEQLLGTDSEHSDNIYRKIRMQENRTSTKINNQLVDT